jgi:NAD(P)-dependent dehydrogenase (short-subunit alcohol dehydrogenase family)
MPSVLVTGAARGIGRATAIRLAGAGWDVIAGVRRAQDGDELARANPGRVSSVVLDVTNDEQVSSLVDALPARLDALVNNAGIAVTVPVEAVRQADFRHQFDVNVVGQAAVTQAVLPRLRESRGRIVFVSSVSGRVATPLFGPYAASKFALEGMADALRMELAPWGIRVALVEPAQTDTDLWRNAEETFEETVAGMSPQHRELYAKHLEGARKSIPRAARMAAPVDGVAKAIEKALTATRPRARYVVGANARVQALLGSATPTPVLDRVLSMGTGVPRRA